jgi:hypothetical protein
MRRASIVNHRRLVEERHRKELGNAVEAEVRFLWRTSVKDHIDNDNGAEDIVMNSIPVSAEIVGMPRTGP